MLTIQPQAFWGALKARGFTFMAGVPDSSFGSAYDVLLHDQTIQYVPAVREDVALGVASAAYLSGRRGAVVLQNSGLGNIVNALTSFNLLYQIPVLLLIGWRGYDGALHDAPEHWLMGPMTPKLLQLLEVPFETVEPEGFKAALDRVVDKMDQLLRPGALLMRPGVLA